MSNPADNMIADLANRDFIVFAGAGVPMESGLPITWKELLATFREKEPELATRNIDEVREDEYPDYAQEIFQALQGKGRESRYYEILRETFQATNARCSIQQLDIIETARHVVTTNFDDSFKNAMERNLEGRKDTSTMQSLLDLQLRALNTDYSVSYLHGSTNEKCIVFKTEDYSTFYPSQSENDRGNDNLEQFLRHLYEEWTIVFIGVSFNDKYPLNALTMFYNTVKQNDAVGREKKVSYKSKLDNIQHYAFMPEDMGIEAGERCRGEDYDIREQPMEKERESKRELLAGLRIKVVPYQDPVVWTDWFADIRKERRKGEREKQETNSVFSIENPERIATAGV